MADLETLWEEHSPSPFPPGCTGSHGGCNLMVVDSEIRSAVLAHLESGMRLAGFRRAALEKSLTALERALPAVPPAGEAYFKRSVALGQKLLAIE